MLEKYKSNSELELEKLLNNTIWNNSYSIIYYLGAINQLKMLAEALGTYHTLNKTDILALINSFKSNKDAPDEIKNLIDMILEEFDFKED